MNDHVSFWKTWPGVCAMLLIAGLLFFLVTEHTAHFFGLLPYGILLLCPLMHLFMHKGHGGHDSQAQTVPVETSGPELPNGSHHH